MSAALTASTAPLAKLSAPARSQLQQRRRAQAAVVTSSSSSGVVHDGKNTANNNSLAAASLARRVALGAATVAVPLLAIAQPAHAMEGALAVFNGNPALVRGEKRGLFLQKQRSLQKKKKCARLTPHLQPTQENKPTTITATTTRTKSRARHEHTSAPSAAFSAHILTGLSHARYCTLPRAGRCVCGGVLGHPPDSRDDGVVEEGGGWPGQVRGMGRRRERREGGELGAHQGLRQAGGEETRRGHAQALMRFDATRWFVRSFVDGSARACDVTFFWFFFPNVIV